jgi:hypothetical protein
MARRDAVFPSKYLKAADLSGKPLLVTVESAPIETLKSPEGKEQSKTVLYFKGTKKCFPLNVTNWDAVVDVTSEDDSDNWPGHKLELFPTTTTMAGKLKDCIRIRPPAQRELPKQRPARPKPTKKGGAAEKLTLAEEMDDEIPFDP